MLDIAPPQLALVRQMLAQRLPGATVQAFGSRVNGWPFGRGSKAYSDLDLAIWPADGTTDLALAELRADFEDSQLPWRVDLTLARDLPATLAHLVQTRGVLLQPWTEVPADSALQAESDAPS